MNYVFGKIAIEEERYQMKKNLVVHLDRENLQIWIQLKKPFH